MERIEALNKISEIVGEEHNLHKLAEKYQITPISGGKQNKGWAGQVIERHLGLPINSAQSPNFGSWELKSVSIKYARSKLVFKETMAITMIDPYQVIRTPFKDSHLLQKLRRFVCVLRFVGKQAGEPTYIHSVHQVDLDEKTYNIVENDYKLVQSQLEQGGLESLSGSMGHFIQPRTKGPGHGSVSRAFYARKNFLNHVMSLE